MSDTRLTHLFSLLESKNRAIRAEAAAALGRYSIHNENLVQVRQSVNPLGNWLIVSVSEPSEESGLALVGCAHFYRRCTALHPLGHSGQLHSNHHHQQQQ